eukprot:15311128-Alexandrium_andersonii.AAC.1
MENENGAQTGAARMRTFSCARIGYDNVFALAGGGSERFIPPHMPRHPRRMRNHIVYNGAGKAFSASAKQG